MKIKFWHILFFSICIFSFLNKEEIIERYNTPEIINGAVKIIPHAIDIQDTIPNDTIFEFTDKNNQQLYYSRKISTGVCIDGECRLVSIVLYWTVTGRYLGFKLPPGEFLSRTKHKPFHPQDYDRLHVLLSDPLSPLSQYSIEELVPHTDSTQTGVDAVSTATIAAVLDYIVEGAVYTTYTLWHIVYGPTKRKIEKLTAQQLTPELTMKLLNSKNIDDQVWAMEHMHDKFAINKEICNILMANISGNDLYLAERSLNALSPEILKNDSIQKQLGILFSTGGFLKQRLILERLKDAPSLSPALLHQLLAQLEKANGVIVKLTTELFSSKKIEDKTVTEHVLQLLNNDNRYISYQACKYLETLSNMDKKNDKKLKKYKKNNRNF